MNRKAAGRNTSKRIVLNGRPARSGRPGEHLAPADFRAVHNTVEAEIGRKPDNDEVLSYLMYPDVFLKFAKARAAYSDVDVLPTPQFFFGMQKGEEIAIDIEAGKTLVVKFLAVSEPHPDGTRTGSIFEINGQPREVDVRDKSLISSVAARTKADPANPGQVGAPLPGLVTAVAVSQGATVKKGDKLLVIEAMKMQSTVYVPIDGKVSGKLGGAHRHAGRSQGSARGGRVNDRARGSISYRATWKNWELDLIDNSSKPDGSLVDYTY